MVSVSNKENYSWLLSRRWDFNFNGGERLEVSYDRSGVDGLTAFHVFDSTGKVVPTKHPNILQALFVAKGSLNLNIKMWAQSRAEGSLPLCMFSRRLTKQRYQIDDKYLPETDMETELGLPGYVINAVENQMVKWLS